MLESYIYVGIYVYICENVFLVVILVSSYLTSLGICGVNWGEFIGLGLGVIY